MKNKKQKIAKNDSDFEANDAVDEQKYEKFSEKNKKEC